MNRRIVSFAVGMALSLSALPVSYAEPVDEVNVKCPNDSIGSALGKAKPGTVLIITVTNTCTEDVTIVQDDVVLQGDSGTVQGQITVDGARRVVIQGLTVNGPGNGIEARRNAVVTVQGSMIENNGVSGIDVRQGAFATIDGNTIRSNGECEVLVRDSGHVRLLNNIIEASLPKPTRCNALVGAFRDARIRMGGNAITSTDPSNFAVDVEHGSTFRQDLGHDVISGEARVVNTANADFRDAAFTGNLRVVENSNFRTRNSMITGNVTIGSRSLAVFNSTTSVDGFVSCQGSGTVGLGPPTPLTLVDSLSGPVTTSAGGIGWAFRGAIFGAPTFVPPGGLNGCN